MCGPNRTDSPPSSLLFQNFTQPVQRSSPPPPLGNSGSKNLQMIREDSQDMVENSHSDEEGMLVQEMIGKQSMQEVKQQQFARKPQISITDTHGHVTAVTTSDGDEQESIMEEQNSQHGLVTSGHMTFHSNGSPIHSNAPSHHSHPSLASHPQYSHVMHQSLLLSNFYNSMGIPSQISEKSLPQSAFWDASRGEIPYSAPWPNQTVLPSVDPRLVDQAALASQYGYPAPNFGVQTHFDERTVAMVTNSLPNGDSNTNSRIPSTSQAIDLSTGHRQGSISPIPSFIGQGHISSDDLDIHKVSSNINLASTRTVDDILCEIKRILQVRNEEKVTQFSDRLFRLENSDVQMELEVCQGESYNGLQVRRISGDKGHYRLLCQQLLSGINLWWQADSLASLRLFYTELGSITLGKLIKLGSSVSYSR